MDAETAVNLSGKTAGLIVDNGMLVMVGVLFLAVGACAIWLGMRFANRKLGDYVHKDDVEKWVKENAKHLLKPEINQLPDMRNHKLFTTTTMVMRQAESIRLEHKIATALTKDLIVWSLRAYRDCFFDYINEAYEAKEGFDGFIGDQYKLRAKIEEIHTTLNAAVRCRLVEDFGFPEDVFARWQSSRENLDRLTMEVLELGLERSEPYWRVRSILDSAFERCFLLKEDVVTFFKAMPTDHLNSLTYEPPAEAGQHTMGAFKAKATQGYAAAIFDKQRKAFG